MGLLRCARYEDLDQAVLNGKRRWCNRCSKVVVVLPFHGRELIGHGTLEIVCTHCMTENENRNLQEMAQANIDEILDGIENELGES